MDENDLKQLIRTIIANDGDDTQLWKTEKELFQQSMILQQVQLKRTPSENQVKASWARWKRERQLDASAEQIDTASLWKDKGAHWSIR